MPRFGQPPNLDRGKLNHTNDGAIAYWSSIIPERFDPGHDRMVGLSLDFMLSPTRPPDTNCTHAARPWGGQLIVHVERTKQGWPHVMPQADLPWFSRCRETLEMSTITVDH